MVIRSRQNELCAPVTRSLDGPSVLTHSTLAISLYLALSSLSRLYDRDECRGSGLSWRYSYRFRALCSSVQKRNEPTGFVVVSHADATDFA